MSSNIGTVQQVLDQCFENLGQCFAAAVAGKDEAHSLPFYRAVDRFLDCFYAEVFDCEVSDSGSLVEDPDELSADDVLRVFEERSKQKFTNIQDAPFSGLDLDLVCSTIQRFKDILNQSLEKIRVDETHSGDFHRAIDMFRMNLGYQEEVCRFESGILNYPNLQIIDHSYLN